MIWRRSIHFMPHASANRTELLSYEYTEKEIDDIIAFVGFSINDNVLDQMRNTAEYVKKQTYETRNS